MDTALGTETSVSYDAGFYRRIAKSLDVRVAANYINTSNYYVTNTASIYMSASYAYSIPTMRFYGVESEFNWAPLEKLDVFGNYSYLKNSFEMEGSLPYALLLELPPRNKGKLSVRYTLPFKTRFSSDIRFMGERKSEGGYMLPRYTTADIGFERNLGGKITGSLFVNNLLDKEYRQVYGYPSPGRTFGVRIQLNTARNPFGR
jgi:outer membrane receptor protein involved in Fe transport